MDTLVIKVGGNELDDPSFLDGLTGAIGWLQTDHRVVLEAVKTPVDGRRRVK